MNISARNKYLKIFWASLILFSCTERIDIHTDSQEFARLVVEGSISTDTTAHMVKLTTTADYFDDRPPRPVSGAQVMIISETDFFLLTETPAQSGIYLTEPDVFGKVGQEYRLQIQLEEEIGGAKEFEASSKIFPINQIDSIALQYNEDWGEEGFVEVKCYVWDPPTEDFYMFHTYINGQLTNDSINRIFVVDDILYNGNYTNGIGVSYLDQSNSREALKTGDTVTLRAGRITKEFMEFINQLQDETGYQTPVFSGPPANIHGNISNGAFGFFGAFSLSYASVVVPDFFEQ